MYAPAAVVTCVCHADNTFSTNKQTAWFIVIIILVTQTRRRHLGGNWNGKELRGRLNRALDPAPTFLCGSMPLCVANVLQRLLLRVSQETPSFVETHCLTASSQFHDCVLFQRKQIVADASHCVATVASRR